jgi:hypothetical protein
MNSDANSARAAQGDVDRGAMDAVPASHIQDRAADRLLRFRQLISRRRFGFGF